VATFDGEVLQQYANRLYARARLAVVVYALVGCAIGGTLGYLPEIIWYWTNSNSPPPGEPPIWIGVVGGAVIFGLIGNAKAFKYRLLAQWTLCQMQIERNTRRN
jgi:hypothetical protein